MVSIRINLIEPSSISDMARADECFTRLPMIQYWSTSATKWVLTEARKESAWTISELNRMVCTRAHEENTLRQTAIHQDKLRGRFELNRLIGNRSMKKEWFSFRTSSFRSSSLTVKSWVCWNGPCFNSLQILHKNPCNSQLQNRGLSVGISLSIVLMPHD